ncbi:HD-GYP domain-containing protein [Caldisalinibacter kiritimatiensis]|uniref:Metal dependent phosphohydrolase n=1 Tax=Caldisalinibacter kiritimatiensis TaxID=1304284 RepID=R1CRY6_9FIRM|nr:HD domain-containing phosphohydrolase [Caldisalinibacter kiritimatiensis]EOD01426.1 metal dependent phosphohydrolase [Caldisalinibacter kiritimatiensis]
MNQFVLNLEDLRHGVRVAHLSVKIGEKMNLKNEDLKKIEIASIFHDIGKAYLDQNILNKPGRLDKEERIHIQKHVEYSCIEILKMNMENTKGIAKIIRYHHENFDGTGYPEKLKGKQIPIGSRIIRIADVYDALTFDRVYRNKLTHEQALKIMEEEKRYFDPILFSGFLKLFAKNSFPKIYANQKL